MSRADRASRLPNPPSIFPAVLSLVLAGCMLLETTARLGAADPVAPAADSASFQEVMEEAEALKQEQLAIADQLNQDFPHDFEALRILGFVHSSHGNLDEMYQCWLECSRLEPDRADVYEQLGRHAAQIENYEEAVAYWQKALEIAPDLPGAHLGIGSALLNLGRLDEAVAALQQELRLAPENGEVHFLLAEALFQQQDFPAAKASYLQAVQFEPQSSRAYYGLIKTCTRLREKSEVERYSQEFQRVESAIDRADQEARRRYDDLQQIRERLAVTCTDAGRLYGERENLPLAERLWTRAVAVDAKNRASRSYLASLYATQGKYVEAIRLYQELLELDPQNAVYCQQLGFLQAREGDLQAAEESLRKAIRIAPQRAAGYRALAKLYLNTGQETEAARQLSATAVKLEPVADSFFVLSWSNAKVGRLPEARAAIQRAMQLAPENATYRKLDDAIRDPRP